MGGTTNDVTRVLVIEDDVHLRDLLEIALDLDAGIDVFVLDDERKAGDACKAYRPDVILLDVNLPFMSGAEVAAEIRTIQPEVRIISMSGMDPDDRPWADRQIVKTGDLVEDVQLALSYSPA